MSVHAYEDPGRPEGGHAVVLLQGIAKAPGSVSFRLKPGDATVSGGADAAGWPHGDQKPLATRLTPEGLELQLGPEITECELLLPGTLVEIEVAAADARGEFLWPNIAPVLRPKRRTVIVNEPRRKGAPAEPARAETTAPATTAAVSAEKAMTTAPEKPASTPSFQVRAAPVILPDSSTIAATAAAPAAYAPTHPVAPPDERTARSMTTRGAPALQAAAGLRGATALPNPSATSTRETDAPAATLRGALPAGLDAPKRPSPASEAPRREPAPVVASRVPQEPVSELPPPPEPAKANRRTANFAQFFAGLVAVAAAAFVLSRESSMRTVAPLPPGDAATTVSMAAPPAQLPSPAPIAAAPAPVSERGAGVTSLPATAGTGATGVTTAKTDAPTSTAPNTPATSALFDALAVGAMSPRGASGAGVSAARSLDNANAQLTGPARDPDEAGFWLRRYLAQTLGNERTTRALTQLGSVYAEPAHGAPDYVKARLVWEIASAAGDPVAMCFLGLLSENGLGGPMDKRAALNWYERSKQAGGCPAVDDAIARVR